MRTALAVLLTGHALIHLMGFLKAFGFADLPQLTIPISRPLGIAWLVASLALLGAAATLLWAPRAFWLTAAFGVVVSQFVILSSWSDAKFGTIPNLLLLLAALHSAFSDGPWGLRAAYAREVRLGPLPGAALPITEADLAPLPAPVQRYLRFVGVVGSPQVNNYRIRFAGRIRSAADAPWMAFTAEQLSLTGDRKRLFLMDATMNGVPVDVFHSYIDGKARMQVKVLSLYPMVDAGGFDFTTAETVTIFNDMCVMAPATLIDPDISWKQIDEKTVEGTFTNVGHTIRALLHFDDSGALINFTSEDRPRLGPDGKTLLPQRWSTPLKDYRNFGPYRLPSHGDARYQAASGEFTYGEFDLQEITYNVEPH